MEDNNRLTDREIANDKADKIMNTVAWRCAYYRANPQRFVSEVLGIQLRLFQKILIWAMMHNYYFMYIASRGQGKTFLTALFCVVRCILFPESKIVVTSGTKKQGNESLLKIQDDFMKKSPFLCNEIEFINIGVNDAKCSFKNGSWIRVVTSNDNSRGARANILIVDEYRMVKKEVIDKVLKKFLSSERLPRYFGKEEYKNMPHERNIEMYMSSAWYKSDWSFEKCRSYVTNFLNDTKRYFVCCLPYQLPVKEGLLNMEQIQDEMSESDFDATSFSIEMEAMWFGDTDGAFFTFDDVSKRRKLKTAIYPYNVKIDKKNQIPDLAFNEKRVMSVDIALLASKKKMNNDASSITINSAIPNSNNLYISNIIYIENYEGLTTDEFSLIVRRLFEQYKCTDLVLDTNGQGLGVYDSVIRDMYDDEFGITYKALGCKFDMGGNMAERCKISNAPKVIWSIKASEAFNTKMCVGLRSAFQSGKINLLVSEFDADEILKERVKGFSKLDAYNQVKYKSPYIQTSLLVYELINLEHEVKGTNIRIKEKAGMRKDRYSSLGMNYWAVSKMELDLQKPKENLDLNSARYFATAVTL